MSSQSTVTTDAHLLERAARAAGITGFVAEDWNGPYFCTPANPLAPHSEPVIYRWLQDDGDALRLAITLCLDIRFDRESDGYVDAGPVDAWTVYMIDVQGSRAAATRRAIVRAAADMERAK